MPRGEYELITNGEYNRCTRVGVTHYMSSTKLLSLAFAQLYLAIILGKDVTEMWVRAFSQTNLSSSGSAGRHIYHGLQSNK